MSSLLRHHTTLHLLLRSTRTGRTVEGDHRIRLQTSSTLSRPPTSVRPALLDWVLLASVGLAFGLPLVLLLVLRMMHARGSLHDWYVVNSLRRLLNLPQRELDLKRSIRRSGYGSMSLRTTIPRLEQ